MARRRQHTPLRVYQNNRLLGQLLKEPSGAIEFIYDQSWLDYEHAFPVSLSLPLREDAYRGAPVSAVFENLLPDSEGIRRRVAEKVDAEGSDAYSLLAKIGRDCVGALQFMEGSDEIVDSSIVEGEAVSDREIERILNNLARAPLGLDKDDGFRISVAGAQEKTGLLRRDGKWLRPHGTTATTHIVKTQIGKLPNGIDLTNSVENEFYCLKLVHAFGLPVNAADIQVFGGTRALVIKRFDRQWSKEGRLLRLPQEDCCQALSVPPSRKYESEGGPGMLPIIDLLNASDAPADDQAKFFKAQILFWLIGATDGHAKNFSIYLMPGGGFQLTPLYDILTAQQSLDTRQIRRNHMRLAMRVGNNGHYRFDDVMGRHFVETGLAAGLPKSLMSKVLDEVVADAPAALESVAKNLPKGFPMEIHDGVSNGVAERLKRIAA